MTDLRTRLLAFLSSHRGRANAIRRADVLYEMQYHDPSLTDRAFRALYQSLPICTTASVPRGMYLPETAEELDGFFAEYACHARPDKVNARRAVFMRERPDLRPDAARQMELPL